MKIERLLIGLAISLLAITVFWDTGSDPKLEQNTWSDTTFSSSTTTIFRVTTTVEPTTTTATTTTTTTTTIPVALVNPDAPCQEWLPIMLEAGWPADRMVLETALTIAWRESRCQANADSGPDHGIYQVNQYWCRPSRYTPNGWLQDRGILSHCDDLFNPQINVRAALAIYHYSLDKHGDGFLPWTTYSGK
jgi:hypothetical protein